jgi:hypothetical protein
MFVQSVNLWKDKKRAVDEIRFMVRKTRKQFTVQMNLAVHGLSGDVFTG